MLLPHKRLDRLFRAGTCGAETQFPEDTCQGKGPVLPAYSKGWGNSAGEPSAVLPPTPSQSWP